MNPADIARRGMLAILAVLLLAPGQHPAHAWGYLGHEVTGAIADRMLTASATRKVAEIAGMNLQAAAKWADCVKSVIRAEDGAFRYAPEPVFRELCVQFERGGGIARMEDYVRRNWDNCSRDAGSEPCHRQYHYTNVAIQRERYDRSHAGTRAHDIVGSINAAIAVLRGKPAPTPYSIRDRREALLLLAHFVGDIHQPLHVSAIYLDGNDQLVDPEHADAKAGAYMDTRGGNLIDTGYLNLHALWDGIPPWINTNTINDRMLRQAGAIAITSGDPDTWATAWATETMRSGRRAYRDLTYARDPAKPGRWVAQFDDEKKYMRARAAIQAAQLTRAGARLAHVLNGIWP